MYFNFNVQIFRNAILNVRVCIHYGVDGTKVHELHFDAAEHDVLDEEQSTSTEYARRSEPFRKKQLTGMNVQNRINFIRHHHSQCVHLLPAST